MTDLLTPVAAIAERAAKAILKIYETDFSVESKKDNSPLTAADLAAHRVIVQGLQALTPDLPVLSEEAANIPYSTRRTWSRYWLVDPLDGTKEFIKKNGEFTVNIALIEGNTPTLGVVHVPVSRVAYLAAAGAGCFRVDADGKRTRLHGRKASPEQLVVAGSRSHGGDALKSFTDKLPGQVELVARGSSLKFCLVAEGAADIYPRFGPTSEWDTAAAQCVVEQAGGQVVQTNFEPLAYNAKADILNPHFLVIGDPSYDWGQYLP